MRAELNPFRSHFYFAPLRRIRLILTAAAIATAPARAIAQSPADSPPAVDQAQCRRYIDDLASSRIEVLTQERYWFLLNHYQREPFGVKSEIRNPDYFLSPRGRFDPSAEMKATLDGFCAPSAAPTGNMPSVPRAGSTPLPAAQTEDSHPQCRFPGRYLWLRETLAVDRVRVQNPACPHFHTWMSDIAADSVTLIFASAYLDNPSSMYGHTFLRFDQKAHGDQARLLDTAVNYAADPTTQNGILFAAYGMFGVFPAHYSAMPYYLKVQEYSNFESRDLWEYSLNLSTGELNRMLLHLWEMNRAEFPYYFFNKNCSYQLLALFDVARPSLELTKHWPLYVIPFDTVRAIQRKGLIDHRIYRPSQTTKIVYERKRLFSDEAKIARSITEPGAIAWPNLLGLPPDRRALTLDTALDYLQYKVDYRKDTGAANAPLNQKLLTARSEIPIKSPLVDVPAPVPPDEGHATGRAAAGYGYDNAPFAEASVRLALHDLLDSPQGYSEGSELDMLDLRLREDIRNRRTYLQSFDAVRIVSLAPVDTWIKKPSWMVDGGVRQAIEQGKPLGRAGYAGLTAGTGVAAKFNWRIPTLFYFLAEGDTGAGKTFSLGYRLGGGPVTGGLMTPTDWWRVQIEAALTGYALGDQRSYGRAELSQQFDLSKRISLRISLQRYGESKNILSGLLIYF